LNSRILFYLNQSYHKNFVWLKMSVLHLLKFTMSNYLQISRLRYYYFYFSSYSKNTTITEEHLHHVTVFPSL
jgi:hypothetical protein